MQLNSTQKKYLKWAIWLFIILPGIPFVLITIGYIGYLYWPHDIDAITEIKLSPNATRLTLSVHGVKDTPSSWSDELQGLMAVYANNPTQQQISVDWRPYSDNPMICSVVAKSIGQAIADNIIDNTQVRSIHAVGHSCGSFVAYGLCQRIKQRNPEIQVQTTYLDPVSIYGGFWWNYGVEHFGDCADFSDAYIDTGDTVPGSNQPLLNAHTFDVTQVRITEKSNEPPHNWPTKYYLRAYQQQHVPLLFGSQQNLNEEFVKGQITVVE